MRIADLLHDKPDQTVVTVRTTDSLKKAIRKLHEERIGAMLVVNGDDELVGMLSERDLIGVLSEYGERALTANVGALMSEQVYYCVPEDSVEDAMRWMVSCRVRHLPVVEGGRLLGLVSIGDVVKHLIEDEPCAPRILEEGVHLGELRR